LFNLRLLIFDLDGTLIDSSEDIVISTNAMLRHMGRPEIDQKTVNSYVGDGVGMLVRRALAIDSSTPEFERAQDYFVKYYRRHSLEHTRLYPGIQDALSELQSSGYKMVVLTNKPARITNDILGALQATDYFFRVIGGDTLSVKKPDPLGIEMLLQEAALTPDRALMIGDSDVDVQTARNAGIKACGVLWGLKPESLEMVKPDFTAADVTELLAQISRTSTGATRIR
jgi:phosphoglycolate phosphatase